MTKTNRFAKRFLGAEAWNKLTREQQAEIGATALELVVAWVGEDWRPEGLDDPLPWQDPPEVFHQAEYRIRNLLFLVALQAEAFDLEAFEQDGTPVPSLLGQVCRVCGCSWYDPCPEGCGWATVDLCSNCLERGLEKGDAA